MAIELYKEKWTSSINVVEIGGKNKSLQIGGEATLPFLFPEGEIPHRPVIAAEIWDTEPSDWPDILKQAIGSVIKNPLEWADKAVKEFKIDLLCLKLQGAHPDNQNKSPEGK